MADDSYAASAPAAVANLRESAKWLIAAAAAVGAILIGSFQLKDLGVLADADTLHRVAAVAGGGLALGTVVMLIIAAARVMITPRPSIRDLSERELRGQRPSTGGLAIVDSNQDSLVRSLLALRSYLFDGKNSLAEIYAEYRDSQASLAQMQAGDGSSNADLRLVQDRAVSSLQAVNRIEVVAHQIATGERFRALTNRLILGTAIFAAALVAFTWATLDSPTAVVDKPTAVTVVVTDRAAAGLPSTCLLTSLDGVAVGGDFVKPTVVTSPAAGCESKVISDSKGIIVIPQTTAK
ncbi:hypothetical protein [Actinoplanes auranticolor]|uniref:Uncharacterized protein n=1 Tax=Actinoplanes auranticolor TaxID=47988 RepID=A0A919SMX6_9ACTN|nr:hypothetical protein [Actinoplanes auranticolor]GIM74526.1 hypothetical protein Aau02nite_61430 [Actinoplanes auranticolor]